MLLRQIWYREVKLAKLGDAWELREELNTLRDLYRADQVKLAQERAHCIYRKKKSFRIVVDFLKNTSLLQDLAILLPPGEAVELINSKEFQEVFIPYRKAQTSCEEIMKCHKNDEVDVACRSLLQSHNKSNRERIASPLNTSKVGVTFDDKQPPGDSRKALYNQLGLSSACFSSSFEGGSCGEDYELALVWRPKALPKR